MGKNPAKKSKRVKEIDEKKPKKQERKRDKKRTRFEVVEEQDSGFLLSIGSKRGY